MRKNYDFTAAKRAGEVDHLQRLQASSPGKTRITIMLDNAVLSAFRQRAESCGAGYQTLINQALRDYLCETPLDEETLRRVLREELGKYQA